MIRGDFTAHLEPSPRIQLSQSVADALPPLSQSHTMMADKLPSPNHCQEAAKFFFRKTMAARIDECESRGGLVAEQVKSRALLQRASRATVVVHVEQLCRECIWL